jgi:Na+/proline symporter
MNHAIAGVFLLGMILIGVLSLKKIKNASSYFVADRNAATPAVAARSLPRS